MISRTDPTLILLDCDPIFSKRAGSSDPQIYARKGRRRYLLSVSELLAIPISPTSKLQRKSLTLMPIDQANPHESKTKGEQPQLKTCHYCMGTNPSKNKSLVTPTSPISHHRRQLARNSQLPRRLLPKLKKFEAKDLKMIPNEQKEQRCMINGENVLSLQKWARKYDQSQSKKPREQWRINLESSRLAKADMGLQVMQRKMQFLQKLISPTGFFEVPQQGHFVKFLTCFTSNTTQIRQMISKPSFQAIVNPKYVYLGEVIGKKWQGAGILVSPKEIFHGYFQNGAKVAGFQYTPTGLYSGFFKEGLRHGLGAFINPNNQFFQGIWEKGKLSH